MIVQETFVSLLCNTTYNSITVTGNKLEIFWGKSNLRLKFMKYEYLIIITYEC